MVSFPVHVESINLIQEVTSSKPRIWVAFLWLYIMKIKRHVPVPVQTMSSKMPEMTFSCILVLYTSEIYGAIYTDFLKKNFTVARLSLKLYNKHDLHKAASQLIKIDLK